MGFRAQSDPSRVTRKMYEDYLETAGRGWVAEIDGDGGRVLLCR